VKPIDAVLIGAGNRGAAVYGQFALRHPWLFRFTAVADPNETRRGRFARDHGLPANRSYQEWESLLERATPGDLVFICTPDRFHFRQAMAFIERGCNIVLEKPVAIQAAECAELGARAEERQCRVVVCHVLRYTPFFSTLKSILEVGRIGQVASINLQENIGYYHFAHSYVRGAWRNSALACPSILAKSCHDLDILYWLAGAKAETVSSMGDLGWFRTENAPSGAPERCMDGCSWASTCPWYGPNLYLTENTGWPASVISDDTSLEARRAALEQGPYGRCVFRCDNDVADRQHLIARFANGVTASFHLNALTADISRTIRVSGSAGEILGDLKEGWLEIRDFSLGSRERIVLNAPAGGHNGGDEALMNDIGTLFSEDSQASAGSRSRLEESLEGHWMAFAAEASRTSGEHISLPAFREEIISSVGDSAQIAVRAFNKEED